MPKTANPVSRRRRPSINVILTAIVVTLGVVVIGGVLVANSGGSTPKPNAVPAEVLRKPDSHTLTEAPGNEVTVVEFLDYQCPSCAKYYHGVTKDIERDYRGRITFVTRNFPLEMHALALPAARAAEAAALQGKYQQMYHALFDNYESWAISPDDQNASTDQQRMRAQIDTFARQIGLDMDRFHADMTSQQVTDRINRDKADGEKAGVSGTPTIFINGTKFQANGQTTRDVANQLRSELDKALAQ